MIENWEIIHRIGERQPLIAPRREREAPKRESPQREAPKKEPVPSNTRGA